MWLCAASVFKNTMQKSTNVVPGNKTASFRSIKSIKINIFYIIYNTYKIRYIQSVDGSWPVLAHFGAFPWDSFPPLLFRDFVIPLVWEALTYSKILSLQFSRVRKFVSKKKKNRHFFKNFRKLLKNFHLFLDEKMKILTRPGNPQPRPWRPQTPPKFLRRVHKIFKKNPDASQSFYGATLKFGNASFEILSSWN